MQRISLPLTAARREALGCVAAAAQLRPERRQRAVRRRQQVQGSMVLRLRRQGHAGR